MSSASITVSIIVGKNIQINNIKERMTQMETRTWRHSVPHIP